MCSLDQSVEELLYKLVERKFAGQLDVGSRELAQFLDEKDELKELRKEFFVPKASTFPDVDANLIEDNEDSIYMCGNSLGLMPKCTERLMGEQFRKWSEMGVFGHLNEPMPWAHGDERCIAGICRVVGAKEEEISMMNGLTVNIHLLFTAFYNPLPNRHKILMESRAFPSDHYAIESQIRLNGLDPKDSMICLEPRQNEELLRTGDIIQYIEENGDSIAIVFFSGIQYYTGQLFEIEKITQAGQKKGCLVGWDLAHAFANVPLQLHNWGIDFACWCTYKYGCSGAGGLAGVFIHSRYSNDLGRERMLGWWSHKMSTRFLMSNKLELDAGANGFRISNPPFMLSVGILGFLEVFSKTSMEQLRKKSIFLTGYLEFLINRNLGTQRHENQESAVSCEIITPSDPNERGCQLSLKFNCDIKDIYLELVKRGIAVDKRYPHVIRVAPTHLYNSFEDVWRFVDRLLASIRAVNGGNQ